MASEPTALEKGLHLGIAIAAILLNTIGLIAINLYKKKTNQNIILASISVQEILLSICDLITLSKLDNHKLFYFVNSFAGSQFLACMFILTIDRLVCVLDPLKYRVIVTRKKIILVLLLTVILTIVFAVLTVFVFYQHFILFYIAFLAFCYVFVALAFITYSIVFIKLQSSNNSFGNDNERKKIKKVSLIAGIIIFTFIVLYIIPGSLALWVRTLSPIWRLTFAIGFIIDPCTYIICVKHYREALLNKLKMICSCISSGESRASTVEIGTGCSVDRV